MDPQALPSLRRHGLLSGDEVAKDPDVLRRARPDRAERESWMKMYHQMSQDPASAVIFKGPSVFFSVPDFSKVGPDHPIRRRGLVPITVRLGEFLRDHPDVRVFGVELEPYREDMTDREFAARERVLTPREIRALTERKPVEMWRHHDPADSSHYASDVPHGIVLTPRIAPRYLDLPG